MYYFYEKSIIYIRVSTNHQITKYSLPLQRNDLINYSKHILEIISPFAYGNIQFRISEILVLLAVFNPLYIGGLTLGCLIANLLETNQPTDVIFGTLATFICIYVIYLTGKIIKNYKVKLLVVSIYPTLFNGVIIGIMLNKLYGLPLWLTMGEVALGELVVITFIGVPLFLVAGSRFKNAMMIK